MTPRGFGLPRGRSSCGTPVLLQKPFHVVLRPVERRPRFTVFTVYDDQIGCEPVGDTSRSPAGRKRFHWTETQRTGSEDRLAGQRERRTAKRGDRQQPYATPSAASNTPR